jgi:hypothetical protein
MKLQLLGRTTLTSVLGMALAVSTSFVVVMLNGHINPGNREHIQAVIREHIDTVAAMHIEKLVVRDHIRGTKNHI